MLPSTTEELVKDKQPAQADSISTPAVTNALANNEANKGQDEILDQQNTARSSTSAKGLLSARRPDDV